MFRYRFIIMACMACVMLSLMGCSFIRDPLSAWWQSSEACLSRLWKPAPLQKILKCAIFRKELVRMSMCTSSFRKSHHHVNDLLIGPSVMSDGLRLYFSVPTSPSRDKLRLPRILRFSVSSALQYKHQLLTYKLPQCVALYFRPVWLFYIASTAKIPRGNHQ